mgnify:CR=1 FL=1
MKNIKKFDKYFESEENVNQSSDSQELKDDFATTLSVVAELSSVFYELYRLDLLDTDCKIKEGKDLSVINEIVGDKLGKEDEDYFESEEDIKSKYDEFVENMRIITDEESVNEGLFDKFKKTISEEDIMSYINKHKGRKAAYNSFNDEQKKAYIEYFKSNPSLVKNDEIALIKWDEKEHKFVKAGISRGPGMASFNS